MKREIIKMVCLLFGVTIALPKKSEAQSVSSIVINAGVGGNNTIDLLNRIDKDCLSHHPDLTILMIGTNDMNSMKHVPLAQYKINLEKIIDLIKKSKSKVLVINILPTYEPYLFTRHPASFYEPEGPSGRRKMVNQVVQQVAKDKKVEFLDINHVFERIGNIGLDETSYISNMANSKSTDGVHPTAYGYRSIALAVYETIINRKLPHTKVVCFGDSITAGDGGTEKKSYPAGLKKLLFNQ
jgi:lysophospholipase L1-like esterase